MGVDLLFQHPEVVAHHDDLVEEHFQGDFLGLQGRVGGMEHGFPLVPSDPELFDDRVRPGQAQAVDCRIHRLLNKLRERHLEAAHRGLRFRGFDAAWFRSDGPFAVVELNVGRRVRNRSDRSHAILRVAHFHTDVQRFDFHGAILALVVVLAKRHRLRHTHSMSCLIRLAGLQVLGAVVLIEGTLCAATMKLDSLKIGSQVYSNVTIFGANSTDLYFRHDKGMANVKLKYLNPELQKQFNYDPRAAAAAERQQADEDALFQGALASNLVAKAQKTARNASSAEESLADPVSDKAMVGKPGPAWRADKWLGEKPEVKGKFVLLNFWAPWSQPCRRSIPELNGLQKRFVDRLVIVALASEPEAEIQALTEPKIEFASGIDGKAGLRTALGITTIPYALLLDPKGIVRYQGHPGALNEKNLTALLGKAPE